MEIPWAIIMSWEQAEVRELKENRYVIIDDEPCRINSISTSKPGKHGEAKARVEGVGIFDEQKHSFVHPVSHKIKVPIIDKRAAQVLAIVPPDVQLTDMVTYEIFNLPIPDEYKDTLQQGMEIQYLVAMDRKKITRV